MKAASAQEIKQELIKLPPKKVLEVCLRLARFKKENKELLSFLLFEAHDEAGFVTQLKAEMDEQFDEVNKNNLYLAKKTLRKILRSVNKYARYVNATESEVELRLHFCYKLNSSGIAWQKNKTLENLYANQLKKLSQLIDKVHEDLRFDYEKQIKELTVETKSLLPLHKYFSKFF